MRRLRHLRNGDNKCASKNLKIRLQALTSFGFGLSLSKLLTPSVLEASSSIVVPTTTMNDLPFAH